MKVGIPTDDKYTVSEHFGRAKYFLIVDMENGKQTKKLIENPHETEENEQSGHGKLLKMLVENKVDKVICSNLNSKMERNLESLKIKVERVGEGSTIEGILHI
ncbi:MAG: NifB/NifX family molybdenum-iron cluster-binding protein [Candidatus Micrarchaeaceae archaeon]